MHPGSPCATQQEVAGNPVGLGVNDVAVGVGDGVKVDAGVAVMVSVAVGVTVGVAVGVLVLSGVLVGVGSMFPA